MKYKEIVDYLLSLGGKERAANCQRFFKTAKGGYGYGDIFLGIRVPVIRQAVKKFKDASLETAEKLLQSKYHEIRLFALLFFVHRFTRTDPEEQSKIYDLYLKNTEYVNNWDLVDTSAHYIVGAYLEDKDKKVLDELSRSNSLWERRISMIATYYYIRKGQFADALRISKQLLHDKEDLIHKAVGWMLREIGNRDHAVEVKFLKKHYQKMPRTMLRYAIEKFDEEEQQRYLTGKVKR
ncbi:DNA alkylation repair protein [Candidatus Calescamantes bacterium]|nr:DNA alkylation repair protein [Candidatus Calescamantes bacterium]